MDEKEQPQQGPAQEIKQKLFKTRVEDVGIFKVNPTDHFIIKGFKYAVNYTMFGFVMFMTCIILLITLVVI